jgi:hypothetical protein
MAPAPSVPSVRGGSLRRTRQASGTSTLRYECPSPSASSSSSLLQRYNLLSLQPPCKGPREPQKRHVRSSARRPLLQDVKNHRPADWHRTEEERIAQTHQPTAHRSGQPHASSVACYEEKQCTQLLLSDDLAKTVAEKADLVQQRCADPSAGPAQVPLSKVSARPGSAPAMRCSNHTQHPHHCTLTGELHAGTMRCRTSGCCNSGCSRLKQRSKLLCSELQHSRHNCRPVPTRRCQVQGWLPCTDQSIAPEQSSRFADVTPVTKCGRSPVGVLL